MWLGPLGADGSRPLNFVWPGSRKAPSPTVSAAIFDAAVFVFFSSPRVHRTRHGLPAWLGEQLLSTYKNFLEQKPAYSFSRESTRLPKPPGSRERWRASIEHVSIRPFGGVCLRGQLAPVFFIQAGCPPLPLVQSWIAHSRPVLLPLPHLLVPLTAGRISILSFRQPPQPRRSPELQHARRSNGSRRAVRLSSHAEGAEALAEARYAVRPTPPSLIVRRSNRPGASLPSPVPPGPGSRGRPWPLVQLRRRDLGHLALSTEAAHGP